MTIPVFYDERQSVPTDSQERSFSESAQKPQRVMEAWTRAYATSIEIRDFPCATREDLCLAHDPGYVEGILSGKKKNGFHNTSKEVADSLVWTVGSFLAASEHAARHRTVAVSPTSGFHHAFRHRCDGFCTFNGLAIAALHILSSRLDTGKVAILDGDMHLGDGTESLVHGNEDILHHCYGGFFPSWRKWRMKHSNLGRLLGPVVSFISGPFAPISKKFASWHRSVSPSEQKIQISERWISSLSRTLEEFKDAGCNLVLYQAGADPHIDDPLGGAMTTEQMQLRDQIIFEKCRELEMGIAWNLAGGYQEPLDKVIELHNLTMKSCIDAYDM